MDEEKMNYRRWVQDESKRWIRVNSIITEDEYSKSKKSWHILYSNLLSYIVLS